MGGYGGVLAQGLLGAIGGGASAAAKMAEEERKAEIERIREERLSKLRMAEYQTKGEIDIRQAPAKAVAEAEGHAKGEEIKRPGIIETARQKGKVETEELDVRDENKRINDSLYAPEEAEREGLKAGARAKAEAPFKAADEDRRTANQLRVVKASAEEARKNHWTQDEDGFMVDGDGNRVRRSERVEGRTVEVFVKGPKPKGEVSGTNALYREELDSINKMIEAAVKSDFPDEAKIAKLREEKRALLQRMGMPALAAPTPANDPLGIRKPK